VDSKESEVPTAVVPPEVNPDLGPSSFEDCCISALVLITLMILFDFH